jgi:hypothetical protein
MEGGNIHTKDRLSGPSLSLYVLQKNYSSPEKIVKDTFQRKIQRPQCSEKRTIMNPMEKTPLGMGYASHLKRIHKILQHWTPT